MGSIIKDSTSDYYLRQVRLCLFQQIMLDLSNIIMEEDICIVSQYFCFVYLCFNNCHSRIICLFVLFFVQWHNIFFWSSFLGHVAHVTATQPLKWFFFLFYWSKLAFIEVNCLFFGTKAMDQVENHQEIESFLNNPFLCHYHFRGHRGIFY